MFLCYVYDSEELLLSVAEQLAFHTVTESANTNCLGQNEELPCQNPLVSVHFVYSQFMYFCVSCFIFNNINYFSGLEVTPKIDLQF